MKETLRCEYVKCGKCNTNCAHGPYWYAYWKEGGKTRKRYIGKVDPRPFDPGEHAASVFKKAKTHGSWDRIFNSATATLELAYVILGLPFNTGFDATKKRYQALSLSNHPDRGEDADEFKYIHAAWFYLKAKKRW